MRILAATILTAVVCITAIAFSLSGINNRLAKTASSILGGDLVLSSSSPIPTEIINFATNNAINTSKNIIFYTMLSTNEDLALSVVKAVDNNYPLIGEIEISNNIVDPGRIAPKPPSPGEIWLESRALLQLDTKVGDKINVGATDLELSAVLTSEPDRIADGLTYAPRALINIVDVENTKAILPGSRVTYKLLVSGNQEQVNNIRNEARTNFPEIETKTTQDESTQNNNIQTAQKYLYLTLLLNLVIAGVTVAIAAKRYSTIHAQNVAVMRSFGASKKQIMNLYCYILMAAALLLGLVGSAIGFVLYITISKILTQIINLSLSQTGIWPIGLGILCSCLLVLCFALPSIISLLKVSPINVLQRSNNYDSDVNWQLHFNFSTKIPPIIRLSLNNIMYNFKQNFTQVIAFATVICVAIILFVIRTDLLNTWQNELQEGTPNYFAINIPEQTKKSFTTFLKDNNIKTSEIYPIIRGTLVKINGEPVSSNQNNGARNGLHRPLNLTWSAQVPFQNDIIAGKWFESSKKPQISIEQQLAERLNVDIGDSLTFKIYNEEITAHIVNIRTVVWSSLTPNFYIIYSPNVIDKIPSTYMNSFYIDTSDLNTLLTLEQSFPEINLINVSAMIDQAKNIIFLASLVIGFIWLFTFIISILLVFAVINANIDMRLYQNNLMRIFGALLKQIQTMTIIEFCIQGIVAGLLGSLIAIFSAKLIASQYFSLHYPVNWNIIIYGPIIGAFIMTVSGLTGIGRSLSKSPIQIRRELN